MLRIFVGFLKLAKDPENTLRLHYRNKGNVNKKFH